MAEGSRRHRASGTQELARAVGLAGPADAPQILARRLARRLEDQARLGGPITNPVGWLIGRALPQIRLCAEPGATRARCSTPPATAHGARTGRSTAEPPETRSRPPSTPRCPGPPRCRFSNQLVDQARHHARFGHLNFGYTTWRAVVSGGEASGVDLARRALRAGTPHAKGAGRPDRQRSGRGLSQLDAGPGAPL